MPKTLYLTIDDAPSADCVNKLDFLDQHHIKAVWFCEGRFIEERFDVAVDMLKRGHIIGNHAFTHPHFSEVSLDQCFKEIEDTHQLVEKVYQQANIERTQRYFRFPFGDKGDGLFGDVEAMPTEKGVDRRSAIQTHLKSLGYTQPQWTDINYTWFSDLLLPLDTDWYWTFDTLDWSANSDTPAQGVDSTAKVLARIDEDVPEGWRGINYPDSADIVLIHDHITPDNLFQQIIEKLLTKDVEFKLPV